MNADLVSLVLHLKFHEKDASKNVMTFFNLFVFLYFSILAEAWKQIGYTKFNIFDETRQLQKILIHNRFTCDALRDLVPLVQFKKREKHPWKSVTFSKIAGFSLKLY